LVTWATPTGNRRTHWLPLGPGESDTPAASDPAVTSFPISSISVLALALAALPFVRRRVRELGVVVGSFARPPGTGVEDRPREALRVAVELLECFGEYELAA
jgi:hypothetical protein